MMSEDLNAGSFGEIHIVEPQTKHTCTAILLHGRGSDGQEFADDFLSLEISDKVSLMTKLPGWRWVFPSSKTAWSEMFQEDIASWFKAWSVADPTERQDLQIGGLMESVKYIETILESEIALLDGKASNVVLGGISQGGSVALWTLLGRQTEDDASQLGGVFAANTWLPFAKETIRRGLNESPRSVITNDGAIIVNSVDEFVTRMLSPRATTRQERKCVVALSHGADDAYVDVSLGKQARDTLLQLGFAVQWNEYDGAEQEGHWLQVPNQVDDICKVFRRVSGHD